MNMTTEYSYYIFTNNSLYQYWGMAQITAQAVPTWHGTRSTRFIRHGSERVENATGTWLG